MRETSLNNSLRDYRTEQHHKATTYDDLRQALARLMVEERGYPRSQLLSQVPIEITTIEGTFCRSIDIVAYDAQKNPLLMVLFCLGHVNTFVRESIVAARIAMHTPFPWLLLLIPAKRVYTPQHHKSYLPKGIRLFHVTKPCLNLQ